MFIAVRHEDAFVIWNTTARKVKEINPNVRVVLMTGFEIRDEEFAKVFPSSRVDGLLRKPITIRDLIIKFMSLIGQSKRRGTNED